MCNEEWGSQTQPKLILSQQSSTNSKYYLMHWLWSMTTSSLPELSVRIDWVHYQEEMLKSLSWISLIILPTFSCDTDWHWHSLCCTIFPHQGLTPAALTHVFGLHSVSGCCAALWCAGQSTTTAPNWAQVAFAASTTQKDLILSLQSISIDLQVEDLKLKIIIQALCSWKLLHQTASFCAKLHSVEICCLSQVRGSWKRPERTHSCLHVNQRIHLCYLKCLQAHYLSVRHLGNLCLT